MRIKHPSQWAKHKKLHAKLHVFGGSTPWIVPYRLRPHLLHLQVSGEPFLMKYVLQCYWHLQRHRYRSLVPCGRTRPHNPDCWPLCQGNLWCEGDKARSKWSKYTINRRGVSKDKGIFKGNDYAMNLWGSESIMTIMEGILYWDPDPANKEYLTELYDSVLGLWISWNIDKR